MTDVAPWRGSRMRLHSSLSFPAFAAPFFSCSVGDSLLPAAHPVSSVVAIVEALVVVVGVSLLATRVPVPV